MKSEQQKNQPQFKNVQEQLAYSQALLTGLLLFDRTVQQNYSDLTQARKGILGAQSLDQSRVRYGCQGHVAQHISRFKGVFIAVQATDDHVNIYRELSTPSAQSQSQTQTNQEPYQTLQTDLPVQCSLEFHDFWILGGNDGTFGTLQVLKPFYNLDGIDFHLKSVEKATQFGAISTLCPMLHGGTYFLTGTLQGQLQLFHMDVETARVSHLLTIRYHLGAVYKIFPTEQRDELQEYAVLTQQGLVFVNCFRDGASKTW